MNRFSNGLLIPRGHRTWQLMHYSEFDSMLGNQEDCRTRLQTNRPVEYSYLTVSLDSVYCIGSGVLQKFINVADTTILLPLI